MEKGDKECTLEYTENSVQEQWSTKKISGEDKIVFFF